jgi:hypothetical protein
VQVTLAGSGFDTLLSLYAGTRFQFVLMSQYRLASNDNCVAAAGALVTYSCLAFNVAPNTVYWLQVDGNNQEKGSVVVALNISSTYAVPPNDAFAAAVVTFPSPVNTLGATRETGEPNRDTGTPGTVWYRFTAPAASTSAEVRFYFMSHATY